VEGARPQADRARQQTSSTKRTVADAKALEVECAACCTGWNLAPLDSNPMVRMLAP